MGGRACAVSARAVFCVYLLVFYAAYVEANGIFRVQRKFAGLGRSVDDLRAHEFHRHGRILGAVDFPLGGNGSPSDAGLYFAELELGTPPNKYYVQVDTGSDILWVNCAGCRRCPTRSDLSIELSFYDLGGSQTGSAVTCDQPFCSSAFDGQNLNCNPGVLCQYRVLYGDGSSTSGYYVEDLLHYDQVSGNYQTIKTNASIVFGCGANQSGDLGAANGAVDGILGFGQSNSSVISQLASAGKVKKMFAHCLDTINGGGIFAIGQVVQPKVKTTPLIPNQPHYNVNMKGIEVGDSALNLPSGVFDTDISKGAIIDSGTTLAYLPEVIYNQLISAIMSSQPNVRLQTYQGFQCFNFIGSVDGQFPTVTLLFEDNLSLTVDPHDYFFQIQADAWCIGWQSSGVQTRDGRDITLLGDLVLSNKLVVYDLENQVIGWTDYNCSSSIQIQDDKTGQSYTRNASNVHASSVGHLQTPCVTGLLLLATIFFSSSSIEFFFLI